MFIHAYSGRVLALVCLVLTESGKKRETLRKRCFTLKRARFAASLVLHLWKTDRTWTHPNSTAANRNSWDLKPTFEDSSAGLSLLGTHPVPPLGKALGEQTCFPGGQRASPSPGATGRCPANTRLGSPHEEHFYKCVIYQSSHRNLRRVGGGMKVFSLLSCYFSDV